MPSFARTVRFRLTIWYTSLLLVFGVAFVVALNVAVRVDRTNDTVFERFQIADIEYQRVSTGPGQGIAGVREQPVVRLGGLLTEAEAELNSDNLDRLQTWSIFAVVGLALASGVGGYMFSGLMLRPVRDMTRVASTIGATNLSKRINHQGPDDELKELADTFDSMIGRLESAFESQRRFVQYASHELRTPLAAIRTNIEVTEMDSDVSADEYRELLDTVKTQTDRLTRLSDDLLLLTATEADPPELQETIVWSLCEEARTQLEPLAARRSITIHLTGDRSLLALAHPDLLYRCVFNLVDNAIKYSPDGGSVSVNVGRQENQVAIDVRDTGPGIAPEHVERVFDRFFRVDKSLSRKTGGAGLGLAIVRELAEAMGGAVELESEVGRGSTFRVRVPLFEDNEV